MVEVVITTPEMLVTEDFRELATIQWEILVVDEAHRLKNHKSKLAVNLRDGNFDFKHSLLLTGTPIQVSNVWIRDLEFIQIFLSNPNPEQHGGIVDAS